MSSNSGLDNKDIVNNPPDSAVADDGYTHFDVPQEVTREIEARHRIVEVLQREFDTMTEATRYYAGASVASCGFLGLGAYLFQRGFRFGDPFASPIRKYTSNMFLCRLANPPVLVGALMACTSLYQIPNDYSNFVHFSQQRNDAGQRLQSANRSRDELVQKWKKHLTPRTRKAFGAD